MKGRAMSYAEVLVQWPKILVMQNVKIENT